MKKQLLFYFSFFTIFTATSQLTFVPDNNFEQALIDLGYDTGALDDYVPTANIENVTFLDVSDRNISDLTGIGGFCSLEELSCNQNQLTKLDLSQNTSLTVLICASNQLTSLDVTQNISLTTLVFSSNDISNIDISQNILLSGIFCYNNQLTSLDVLNNAALNFLYCGGNLLTNLDVSQNLLLEGLRVRDNLLVDLDVSQNPELYIITCFNNQLTNLDVRNGNNININDNNFSSLNNPNLTCIFVDYAAYSTATWTEIDPTSTFVETQAECDLSTNSFEESNFNLYPNPAQNILTIETYTPFKTLEIYTLLGQKVVESTSKIIDVSKLNSGLYVVIIEDESNNTIVKRFIKQ